MISKVNKGSLYGPLQIVHDFKFTALNVKDDYSVINTLDRSGKLEHMKLRIDRLSSLGYGGVVMNVDYKGYLKNPDAFVLFFECAEYAKSLGLKVWIYDEQYYPSGAAGGLTLIDHPELEALALVCVAENRCVDESVGAIRIPSPLGHSELKYAIAAPIRDGRVIHSERVDISNRRDLGGGLCFNAPKGKWRVWCFFLRPLYELTPLCQGTRASRRLINVFNKKAVERFYQVTFKDGYKKYAKDKLGKLVDAVFTDEPYSPFYTKYNHDFGETKRTVMPSDSIYDKPHKGVEIYPYVPWEMTVAERFLGKYGHPVSDFLPDIFEDTDLSPKARIDFYTLLSDMSREAFPRQMADKLGNDGISLSGHYFGEEGFDFHPIFFGDILEHLSCMGIPGCDCLWSDLDVLRYSIACKIGSSAAHLTGRDEVMIEASNMVDQDQNITIERLKCAISTMFAHGINRITSYYSEHLLDDEKMKEFAGHISSLGELFDGGKYRVSTLLYYPFENLCRDRTPMGITEGNYNGEDHLGISTAATELINHQVQFDLINKTKLLMCGIEDGHLISPNKERIKYVVIPNLSWLDEEVSEFLKTADEHGVKVLFDGKKRDICNVNFTKTHLSDGVFPKSELKLAKENPYIIASHRAFGEYDLFMLVNTSDTPAAVEALIDVDISHELSIIDPKTGKATKPESSMLESQAMVSISLAAYETLIISRHKKGWN